MVNFKLKVSTGESSAIVESENIYLIGTFIDAIEDEEEGIKVESWRLEMFEDGNIRADISDDNPETSNTSLSIYLEGLY